MSDGLSISSASAGNQTPTIEDPGREGNLDAINSDIHSISAW
jgi:hypothetical protein